MKKSTSINDETTENKNILELTAFTRKLLRILGGDIYDYSALSENQVKASINSCGLFMCVFCYAVYTYCTIQATIYKENVLTPLYSSVINYYGEYVETFLSFILVSYASLYLACRNKFMLRMFEQVMEIDQSLNKLGIIVNCRAVRMRLYMLTGFQFIVSIVQYLSLTLTFHYWNLETPVCKMIYMIYTINVVMLCLMKFFCLTAIMEIRFRYLNGMLESIVPVENVRGEWVKECSKPKKIILEVTEDTVRTVSRTYAKMHRLRSSINATVGTMVVLLLFSSFITVVLSMFYIMEATGGGLFRYFTRYCFFVYFNLQSVTFREFVIWFIVKSCDNIYKETEKTAVIVHEIINSNISAGINEAARNLSIQLLHEQPHFTAMGLLRLDKKLLLSILGSSTTYLIILMQFVTEGTIDDIVEWDHNKRPI